MRSEPDDHVGARFGLDPGRLRRHRHVFVGHLEEGFDHRLADIEHYVMFVDAFLLDDARHVLQALQHLLAQDLIEDLLLQAHRGHLLQRAPRGVPEVNAVELVVFLHYDLVFLQLVLHTLLGGGQAGDLEPVDLAEFGVDGDRGRDVGKHSVLRMHDHVLARVKQGLDPVILLTLLTQQVVFMCGMHPMMTIQDIQTVDLPKLLLQPRLLFPYLPQRVLPAVAGVPPREFFILLRELQHHPFQGQILPVTDNNRPHVFLLVSVVIEMRAIQRLLVPLDLILMVILPYRRYT